MLNQIGRVHLREGLLLTLAAVFQLSAFAQQTVFTYQGALNDAGTRANGTYDLTFTVYDSTNLPGSVVGGPITNTGVAVSNGYFFARLDFGNIFDGNARWLEIGVRTNGGGSFYPLNPREPLTAVPYAMFSGSATNLIGSLSTANLAPVAALFAGASNGISASFGTNLSLFTNIFNGQLTNGTAPLMSVINVKSAPYNAVGDGVHNDWAAIQSAITTACLSPKGPTAVYIPAGEYRITNTLTLTTQTNVAISPTGDASISDLFGDGGRRTVLRFTMTDANGLEFRVMQSDSRHLSNFAVHDLALMGPAIYGNTNVGGSGYFIGYDPSVPYGGDTVGWQDSMYNVLAQGWKQGLCISNTVFFTVRNCNFWGNIAHSIVLQHADTTRLENNNYGFPPVLWGDQSAIFVQSGAGVLSIGGECGNSACFVALDGGLFTQVGGNFERNLSMLNASNVAIMSFRGCRIVNTVSNYQFNFYDGAAGYFWADTCFMDASNIFNQISGPVFPNEIQIHHALNVLKNNGVFNGAPRVYPPVYFQTPRWQQDYQLANITFLNATALTPLSTSPAPFFSADGLSINNTTGQLWLHMPSGLGENDHDLWQEEIRFTALIQGGTGATNATVTLNTAAQRHDPVSGDVAESYPSFTINGITNGMCKVYSWTNKWVIPTSDTNPRYVRLQFTTTNQIYLINLHAQTIDY